MSDGPADPPPDVASETSGPAVDSSPSETANRGADSVESDTRRASDRQEATTFEDRVAYAREALDRGEHRVDPGLLREYTTDRRSLAETVQFQWGAWTAVGVVILTLIVAGILSATIAPSWLAVPAFLVLFALAVVWVRLRYRRWVYQIRAEALYLERGVLVHRRTLVPYVRIQHVDTSRGPMARALGLSTLVVYTAGSRGADVSIPGLRPDEARDLQGRVKELAIEAEGDDAL